MTPDDLVPGRTYRWDFVSSKGNKCFESGKFVRMYKDVTDGWWWFEFEMTCDGKMYNCPFEYDALNNLRQI